MPSWNVLTQLAVMLLANSPVIMGGEFKPVCGGQSCPSVAWIDASAGQLTSFTLRGSTQSGSSHYVAFAFASGQTMGSAQFVVDCYDVDGVATIATSRNTQDHANSPSPSDASKVTNRNATRNQGALTCMFSMVLPNSTVHALISEGQMDVPSSPPVKAYHGRNKFPSSASYTFPAPATATTVTVSAKTLAMTTTTEKSKLSTAAAKPVTTVSQPVTKVSQPATTVEKPVTTVSKSVTTVAKIATTAEKPVTTVEKHVTTVSKPVTTVAITVTTVTTVAKPATTASMQTAVPSMAGTLKLPRTSSVAYPSSTASPIFRIVSTEMAENAVISARPSTNKMTDIQITTDSQHITRAGTPSVSSFPSPALSNSSSSMGKPDVMVTQDARGVTIPLDGTTILMVVNDTTTLATGNFSHNITAGSSQSMAPKFGMRLDATLLATSAAFALTLILK